MTENQADADNLRKGFLYALAGSAFISAYFVTGKYAMTKGAGFNAETFCLVWIATTTFYASVIVLVRRGVGQVFIPKRSLPGVVGLGLTTGVGLILLYSGLRKIDPTFTAFIARSHPVMVILLGVIFLKERLHRIELLPLVLIVAGGVISVWGRPREVNIGVVLVFLGYVAFAFHRLFIKVETKRLSTEVIVFYRALLALVIVSVWSLTTGRADFDVPLRFWLVVFFGSLISPICGNLLSFHAYRYYSLSQSALVLMIQPVLVLPMAYVFLGTFPTRQGLLGGLLILIGAFAMVWIHFSSSRTPVDVENL